jgi:ribosome recycling factor
MPLDDILLDCEMHMDKALEHLRHELRAIRTGRANPAMVEHIHVEYYGSPTPLKSIAAISVPEAMQILIKPFQPSDLKAIERAINDANLSMTPRSDGKTLRLILPSMSGETRIKMAGQCKGIAETAKVGIRAARRDANKLIETEEKGGVMTEDEAKKAKEDVQELTKAYEAKVDDVIEHKRKEIMEV